MRALDGRDVAAFIMSRPHQKITMLTLVKRFKRHRTTILKILQEDYGTTSIKTLQKLARIRRSKLSIRKGVPGDLIAARCGYASFNGFRRAFREVEGITVTEYRKKHGIPPAGRRKKGRKYGKRHKDFSNYKG